MATQRILHPEPAWRERGDSEIPVRLVFAGQSGGTDVEVLWCEKRETNRYVLCCVPFVLGGLALGDEMMFEPEESGAYRFVKVVRAANNITFRAWFGKSSNPAARDELLEALRALGCLTEEYVAASVIAINASKGEPAESVERMLKQHEEAAALSFDKTYSVPAIDYKIHHHPVWGEKANAVIHAPIEHEGAREMRESLWAKYLSDNRYQICCIPFFVYDLALADEVSTRLDDTGSLLFEKVLKPSGNETFWIFFNEPDRPDVRANVYHKITGLGCIVEGYNKSLLAFNAESESQARLAVASLKDEIAGELLECVSTKTA
jgi:hypothetical protein